MRGEDDSKLSGEIQAILGYHCRRFKTKFLILGKFTTIRDKFYVTQLNLSTMATLGTEESGRCGRVFNKSQ